MSQDAVPVSVNMLSLYNYMKHILGQFDLNFSDMDKISMIFTDKTVTFRYEEKEVMDIMASITFINSQY
jgi:hypothetical protein